MGDRPAEGGEAELQEGEEDFARRPRPGSEPRPRAEDFRVGAQGTARRRFGKRRIRADHGPPRVSIVRIRDARQAAVRRARAYCRSIAPASAGNSDGRNRRQERRASTGEVESMSAAERQAHWENVYATKGEKEVSWFQQTPAPTLELLALIGATSRSAVIDVGGGASRLVDQPCFAGLSKTLRSSTCRRRRSRRPRRASPTRRIGSNGSPPTSRHGSRRGPMTSGTTARRFTSSPMRPIRPPISTACDAPCAAADTPLSGRSRSTARRSAAACRSLGGTLASLGALLGPDFVLVDARPHEHETPRGAKQRFQFSTFRFRGRNERGV